VQIRTSIPVFFPPPEQIQNGISALRCEGEHSRGGWKWRALWVDASPSWQHSLWPLSNSVPYSRSRLILRRAESQRNCTKVQKCIPVLVHGRRLEIHAGTKLGGDGFVGAVGRIDGRRSKSIRDGKAITENVPSVPIPRFPSRFPQSPILCYEYEGGYCRCTRNGND